MKLTKEESAWLKKVQTDLNDCPSKRLGFYTIGDPTIEVYDQSQDRRIFDLFDSRNNMDFCTAVSNFDADMGTLTFPSCVHSTAG